MSYSLKLLIREGSLGNTGKATKLHLLLEISLNNSRGPHVELQNYTLFECMLYQLKLTKSLGTKGQNTKLHIIPALTLKYFWGPQVKLQKDTDFECISYPLKILIRKRVTWHLRTNNEITPKSCCNLK